MKGRRRHVLVWRVLRFLISPWIRRKFAFSPEIVPPPGPCLVLANHNSDWDPLLLAPAFPQQMYFIASEHIFRWGFLSRIICWLVAPIPLRKGSSAAGTVVSALRYLKAGMNVALFAEGNKSFSGVTCQVHPTTAKLARSGGAWLVTYRLEGGYLTSPRWSAGLRRGKMTGRCAGVYSPETLQAMTTEEVDALIRRDLWEDAFERQEKDPVAYKGKRLAEHLETALCLCPRCGQVGALQSRDDRFFCSCGLDLRYGEDGFFTGTEVPFSTVRDWDAWQLKELDERVHAAGEDPIFPDDAVSLFLLGSRHRQAPAGSGVLRLYRDRLLCAGETFPLEKISGMSLRGDRYLNMTADGRDYELVPDRVACLRKYLIAFETLKQKPHDCAPCIAQTKD